MELSAKTVNETFKKCLFNNGEPTEDHKLGHGIMMKVGFHPARLKESELIISELLDELPDNFKLNSGGGWSFLNMCEDKHGKQWADLHQTMDELLMLGLATGKLRYTLPRELWRTLPGGMPYLNIKEPGAILIVTGLWR